MASLENEIINMDDASVIVRVLDDPEIMGKLRFNFGQRVQHLRHELDKKNVAEAFRIQGHSHCEALEAERTYEARLQGEELMNIQMVQWEMRMLLEHRNKLKMTGRDTDYDAEARLKELRKFLDSVTEDLGPRQVIITGEPAIKPPEEIPF
jgi:hypothetical protein